MSGNQFTIIGFVGSVLAIVAATGAALGLPFEVAVTVLGVACLALLIAIRKGGD